MEFEIAMLEFDIEGPFETMDSLMPVFEYLMSQGVVLIIKMDGERTQNIYTLLLSKGTDFHLRRDTDTLIEGVKSLILKYLEVR